MSKKTKKTNWGKVLLIGGGSIVGLVMLKQMFTPREEGSILPGWADIIPPAMQEALGPYLPSMFGGGIPSTGEKSVSPAPPPVPEPPPPPEPPPSSKPFEPGIPEPPGGFTFALPSWWPYAAAPFGGAVGGGSLGTLLGWATKGGVRTWASRGALAGLGLGSIASLFLAPAVVLAETLAFPTLLGGGGVPSVPATRAVEAVGYNPNMVKAIRIQQAARQQAWINYDIGGNPAMVAAAKAAAAAPGYRGGTAAAPIVAISQPGYEHYEL